MSFQIFRALFMKEQRREIKVIPTFKTHLASLWVFKYKFSFSVSKKRKREGIYQNI